MAPIAIYEQQISKYAAEIATLQRRLSGLSWARMGFFLLAGFCVYQFFMHNYDWKWLIGGFISLVVFAVLLVRYMKLQHKLVLQKTLLDLNEKEWRLGTTGQSGFEDGSQFVDEQHPFTGDLDVFGHASLYAHMNRTGTLLGAKELSDALKMPLQDVTAINQQQDVIRELMPRMEFRQLFAAQAKLAEESPEDIPGLYRWLSLPLEFINKGWLNVVRWLFPALLLTGAVVYFTTDNYAMFSICLTLNLLVLGMCLKSVNKQHQLIANKERTFSKFALLLKMISQEKADKSVLLKEEQEHAVAANVALDKLARICNALDQRLNQLVGVVLNVFVLYDLHCVFAIERWKVRYQDDVKGWLELIAKMEAWNSMATFAFNHPEYIYPVINDQSSQLIATEVGHPLIPAAECVRNDISIGDPQHFLIITGSNMSGKSTFLRSVGSNLLLALSGMPVCAGSFTCSPVQIMTSMRIKDSIAKHTSYFQAELLRLQQIVEVLKGGARVFILLDEILKGTNSEDKLSGSRRLIEHFLQYHCLGMIATHDLELGHMEDTYPQRIRNYCFESTIKDEQLFFDYRIREGVARNKNATFLMQKMEII